METATKSISLFNAYERLKFTPPIQILFFTCYPVTMFPILGLKINVKSKL